MRSYQHQNVSLHTLLTSLIGKLSSINGDSNPIERVPGVLTYLFHLLTVVNDGW